MATAYTYDLTIDFSSGINIPKLNSEIKAQISTNFYSNVYGDKVKLIFDSALSGGDQTTLNGIISAHDPNNYAPIRNYYSIPINKSIDLSEIFIRVLSYAYAGNNIQKLENIKIISNMDTGNISYTTSVYDSTNDNEIVSKILLNTSEQINDLGTLNNLPNDNAEFDIQIKKTGGTINQKVYIQSIGFYFS